MKSILIIGPLSKQINGMTVANKMLLNGLRSKFDVEFIDTIKEEGFSDKSRQGRFSLLKFLKIFKDLYNEMNMIMKKKYDYIYMTPGQSFLGFCRFIPYMIVSIFQKKSVYIHIHGSKFREMFNQESLVRKIIIKFFLNKTKGVIVLGGSLKTMLEGIVPSSKIFICENGVENQFVGSMQSIQAKLKMRAEVKKQEVLFLSNLMEDKGILTLLKAAQYFSDTDIRINLAGAIEPSIKSEVMNYVHKSPKKIIYNGIVDGKMKKKLLLNSDILVLPSKDEGQPIAILEAYANACSVITDQDVGGIGDIFSHNYNGFSCKYSSHKDIVNGIKYLTINKESMENNYNFFNDKFTQEKFVGRVIDILENN